MKKTLALIAVFMSSYAALAADYDYEVEYVKSTHNSVVKTDLLPQPGLSFKMDLKFEGPYNQMFGGQFDLEKNTATFFGQEDAPDTDKVRDLFKLSLGGHEAQTYQSVVSLGRKSPGKWVHCGLQMLNGAAIGGRLQIVYDGHEVSWGGFRYKLEGERTATGKVPVSFFGLTCCDGSVKSYASYDVTLYGAEFYKEGKPVAQFVPVVKDGVPGLFEKISRKFYASKTGTPLEAGPKAGKKSVS